jgi:hypothetical protein
MVYRPSFHPLGENLGALTWNKRNMWRDNRTTDTNTCPIKVAFVPSAPRQRPRGAYQQQKGHVEGLMGEWNRLLLKRNIPRSFRQVFTHFATMPIKMALTSGWRRRVPWGCPADGLSPNTGSVLGLVRLSYNPYILAGFFNRNSVFLSQQISENSVLACFLVKRTSPRLFSFSLKLVFSELFFSHFFSL